MKILGFEVPTELLLPLLLVAAVNPMWVLLAASPGGAELSAGQLAVEGEPATAATSGERVAYTGTYLLREPGAVAVEAASGAQVAVDGQPGGPGNLDLAAGQHSISASWVAPEVGLSTRMNLLHVRPLTHADREDELRASIVVKPRGYGLAAGLAALATGMEAVVAGLLVWLHIRAKESLGRRVQEAREEAQAERKAFAERFQRTQRRVELFYTVTWDYLAKLGRAEDFLNYFRERTEPHREILARKEAPVRAEERPEEEGTVKLPPDLRLGGGDGR